MQAAIMIALGLLALAAGVAAAPVAVTCYPLYMIVARGTDEAAGEGTPAVVASLVQSQIAGSTSVAVDYPASALDPLYPESVTDGINDTIDKIHAYVDACGANSKIALIGFSQGGNVMTDALAGGVDKPTPLTDEYAKYST